MNVYFELESGDLIPEGAVQAITKFTDRDSGAIKYRVVTSERSIFKISEREYRTLKDWLKSGIGNTLIKL